MSEPALTVVELAPSDAEQFRSLRLEALASDPDAFGQTLESAMAEHASAWAERLAGLGGDRGAVFVARVGESPAGMCCVGPDAESDAGAYFWGMFVRGELRRSGSGSALLRACERWAIEHGRFRMRARVAAPNQDALRFYERLGYRVGAADGFLRPGSPIPVHPIERDLR